MSMYMSKKLGGTFITQGIIDENNQYIPAESNSSLDYFLRNSTLHRFTEGTQGFIYTAEMNHVISTYGNKLQSPYLYFDLNKPTNDLNDPYQLTYVNTVLIKVCVIHEDTLTLIIDEQKIYSVTIESFNNEVTLQNIINEKTGIFAESITPKIIYYSNNYIANPHAKNMLNDFCNKVKKKYINCKIGVIVMEFGDGYETLHTEYKNTTNTEDDKNDFIAHAITDLILLTLETWIIHGDHHTGNFLYNKTYKKSFIIDFGRSFTLNNDEYSAFLQLFGDFITYQTTKSLNILMNFVYHQGAFYDNVRNFNFENFDISDSFFGWIYQNNDGILSKVITILYERIITIHNTRHVKLPETVAYTWSKSMVDQIKGMQQKNTVLENYFINVLQQLDESKKNNDTLLKNKYVTKVDIDEYDDEVDIDEYDDVEMDIGGGGKVLRKLSKKKKYRKRVKKSKKHRSKKHRSKNSKSKTT